MTSATLGQIIGALVAVVLLGPAATAECRWASDEDASSEIEFQNADFVVHADGTWENVTETRTKILKEGARVQLVPGRFVYNSNVQRVDVLEAYTLHEGRKVPVSPDKIEDKPLASSPDHFDQLHQILIPFGEAEVGASLYTKLRIATTTAPLPGLWSAEFTFGVASRESAGHVAVHSEVPLSFEMNDPQHVLAVEQGQDGPNYHVTVDLTRPVYTVPVDEEQWLLDHRAFAWAVLSTRRDWITAIAPMRAAYDRVLDAELPPRLVAIRDVAAAQATLTERVNAVTSELAARLHYLGDWRTNAGKYVPRELAVVAETQYGDCKDFAVATTAILRALGLTADVAWIHRGLYYRRNPVDAALLSDFNHAIVHVRDGDDDRWIDPTNFSSFAPGIYPDIAGRRALVVTGATPELLDTPAARVEDAEVRVRRVIRFAANDQLLIDGTLALAGNSAVPYAGAALVRSKRSLDYALAKTLSDRDDALRAWTVEPYDLSSRIVRDLEFHAHLVQRDFPSRTSAGDAFSLGSGGSAIAALLAPTQDRVSDLANTTPHRYVKTTELHDVKRIGRHSLDCAVHSPWVDFTRTVTDVAQGVRIEDRAAIYQEIIPNAELKSPGYAETQERIRRCLTGASLVYERRSPGFAAHARSADARSSARARKHGVPIEQPAASAAPTGSPS